MTVQNMTPQVEPTPLVSSLTYAYKANGTIRVCLDQKDLIKALIYEYHKTPYFRTNHTQLVGSVMFRYNVEMFLWSCNV